MPFALIIATSILCAACNRQSGITDSAIRTLGSAGSVAGRFITPRGLSLTEEALWVVDRSGRLQKIAKDGTPLLSTTIIEGGRGFPVGVTALPDGGCVLCDTHNSRIRYFDAQGRENARGFGSFGTLPGQFIYPERIASDNDGTLYITEYGEGGANRVQVFDAQGHFLRAFGESGRGPGQFTRAIGIVIFDDMLFITDTADRIMVFGKDGAFRREFGTSGHALGQLKYPYGICKLGRELFVCEYGGHRLQRFTPEGESLGYFGRPGAGVGEFSGPWDVCADRDGTLYVCDAGNHRIVAFKAEEVEWIK